MYIEKWNKSIIKFFSDSNDYSTMDIVQCLTSVIISELQEQNILIWLSDLHWADQKTFTILKNTFQCLIENQENLKKRLCIIIEGRSNEALLFADTITIPRDWELFYNSSVFKKYEVKLWDKQTCIDYLKDVFRVSSGEIPAYYSLFDQLILHSNGNPMHLNEHIHMLINNDYLKYDHNIGIRINKAISDEILTDQILELIRGRILFCRKKYSYLADVLTAIALSDADMHPELQKKLYLWLTEKNTSIEIILKQNGFVKYDGINRFQFIHENYLNAFKEEIIQSDELINIILDFYKGLTNKSEKEELFEIRTCIMQSQYDYNELYVKVIDMIKKSDNLWIKYELYSYLSKIPADKNLPQYIPDYIVYFECCELLIKFGSWETAANNLDKTLLVAADYSNPKLIIYLLKAYQELANIQCDQMKFDAAIESSESGIEIAEIALKQNILKTHFSEIQRLYEKLLARLAVCYWFSGDIESAVSIQKNCLKSAQKNKDSYSENHTKYEYGTIQFHFDIASGISEMEDVLKESKSILELEKYEKTLIEVQLLIGKLMLANKTQDAIQIKEVKLETKRLSEYYKYNPHTYEEFLCATIRGCTFILNDNNKEAYKCFMKSLEFATAGEMPNLEWKAYYNIAQCYILFNDKNNAVMYAEKSLKIIENSIKNSPNQSKIFEKHIEGTIKHLRNIINLNGYYIDNKDNLLSIYYKNLNFVIMN